MVRWLILILFLPAVFSSVLDVYYEVSVPEKGLVEVNLNIKLTSSRYYIPGYSEFNLCKYPAAKLVGFYDNIGVSEFREGNDFIEIKPERDITYSRPRIFRMVFEVPFLEFEGYYVSLFPLCVNPSNVKFNGYIDANADPLVLIKETEGGSTVESKCGDVEYLGSPTVKEELCSYLKSAERSLKRAGIEPEVSVIATEPFNDRFVEEPLCYESGGMVVCYPRLFFIEENKVGVLIHELVHTVQQKEAPIWLLEGTASFIEYVLSGNSWEEYNNCEGILSEEFWECWEEIRVSNSYECQKNIEFGSCEVNDVSSLGYFFSERMFREINDFTSTTELANLMRELDFNSEDVVLFFYTKDKNVEPVLEKYHVPFDRQRVEELLEKYRHVKTFEEKYNTHVYTDSYSSLSEQVERLYSVVKKAERLVSYIERFKKDVESSCFEAGAKEYADALKTKWFMDGVNEYSTELIRTKIEALEEGLAVAEKFTENYKSCFVSKEEIRKRYIESAVDELLKLNIGKALDFLKKSLSLTFDFNVGAFFDGKKLTLYVYLPEGRYFYSVYELSAE